MTETKLAQTVEGFMQERGIKDTEELIAAMNAWSPGRLFAEHEVRAVLEDPGHMDPEFTVVAGDALAPNEGQRSELIRALLDAACGDIRPGG